MMRRIGRRVSLPGWAIIAVISIGYSGYAFQSQSPAPTPKTRKSGKELYQAACSSCHGVDGRGAPQVHVGFDLPLPDFTDCNFASREPSADWLAIAHEGGPVRGFSKLMPAFGDALTIEELALAMGHILSADGVSCTTCHQIGNEGLGTRASFTAGFVVDTRTAIGKREIFGPFDVDAGRKRIMRSSSGFQPEQASHLKSSEVCATCHTLFTHTLGPNGETIGELPEQVPYLEWRHSGYATTRSCQSCHMPLVESQVPISSVLGEPRSGFVRHVFQGGNFFMPRVFTRYRDQLGVAAYSQELDAASSQTQRHLETEAARVAIEGANISGGRLHATVVIESLAGHKLPTAYPSRRVWTRLTVRDAQGRAVFESGAFNPDGSIAGNDNDADPSRFEPHYDEIDTPEKVQIYEAIMTGADKRVTTGLLTGLHYVKDNRLLPRGFNKATADEVIATHGDARDDDSFREGGDRIRYSAPLGQAQGPFRIEAELWYQPIAYRWAHNLRQRKAAETNRFAGMYQSMAGASAITLARAMASAQ